MQTESMCPLRVGARAGSGELSEISKSRRLLFAPADRPLRASKRRHFCWLGRRGMTSRRMDCAMRQTWLTLERAQGYPGSEAK